MENRIVEDSHDAASDQSPEAESFLSQTEHIPAQIIDNSNSIPGSSGVAPSAGQIAGVWTPIEVGQQFTGMFTAIGVGCSFLRPGPVDHWNISAEQTAQLGEAFCPIFQKHVPYGAGAPPWLADAMMYFAAVGAAKQIILPTIQVERQILREAQKQAKRRMQGPSSEENTQTETSEAQSSSPESAAPESHSSSYLD